jgi:hypothetical protein
MSPIRCVTALQYRSHAILWCMQRSNRHLRDCRPKSTNEVFSESYRTCANGRLYPARKADLLASCRPERNPYAYRLRSSEVVGRVSKETGHPGFVGSLHSDSDGSNAIEERRVGFRVPRGVYPVGCTSTRAQARLTDRRDRCVEREVAPSQGQLDNSPGRPGSSSWNGLIRA